MPTHQGFLDLHYTYPTQLTERREFCALGIQTLLEPQYRILLLLCVLGLGGMSSSTTRGPSPLSLLDTIDMPSVSYVRSRFMVSRFLTVSLQIKKTGVKWGR